MKSPDLVKGRPPRRANRTGHDLTPHRSQSAWINGLQFDGDRYGERIQIDGSDHRWFEQRGESCTLLVFIEDATSKLMQLRFVPSESTDSYFEALNGQLTKHGWLTGERSPYCQFPIRTKGAQ